MSEQRWFRTAILQPILIVERVRVWFFCMIDCSTQRHTVFFHISTPVLWVIRISSPIYATQRIQCWKSLDCITMSVIVVEMITRIRKRILPVNSIVHRVSIICFIIILRMPYNWFLLVLRLGLNVHDIISTSSSIRSEYLIRLHESSWSISLVDWTGVLASQWRSSWL